MMSTASASPTLGKPGNLRWVICLLLFFSIVVNYLDRLVIAVLKPELSEQLGWSETDYGMIAAAQSFAYAFGYLFGGRIIDRLFAGLMSYCAILASVSARSAALFMKTAPRR